MHLCKPLFEFILTGDLDVAAGSKVIGEPNQVAAPLVAGRGCDQPLVVQVADGSTTSTLTLGWFFGLWMP